MKRLLVIALMPACGCLSVARIPVPERTVYAVDGTVLDRDWCDAMTHARDASPRRSRSADFSSARRSTSWWTPRMRGATTDCAKGA